MLQPLRFELKSLTDTGEIEGYASTYSVDQGGDKVMPGAFAKSIASRSAGDPLPMLWSHDTTQPIGIWTALTENAAGLHVKGALVLAVEKARETLALLKAKALSGLSIGYRTLKSDYDKAGTRLLKELDLMEISLCVFPMQNEARVVAVKATEIASEREFERFLRDAGFTRARSKLLAKGFVPATDHLRDADGAAVSDLIASIKTHTDILSKGDHYNAVR